jgi:hypothetical protein
VGWGSGVGGEEGRPLVHADERCAVWVFEGRGIEEVVEGGGGTWEGFSDSFG